MRKIKATIFLVLWSILLSVFFIENADAQRRKKKRNQSTAISATYDEALFKSVKWREVGPFRGGRSAAVTVVAGNPNLYYMGAAGGGVWKTENAGQTWKNISDDFFGGSIGSVTVSEWDPNVIYVGGGEVTVRGNVSHGYGVWKSEDAGKTWEHKGLDKSYHIPRIRVHPKNPELVYAAVLGNLYRDNRERGIYRSKDGGDTWEQVLFVSEKAGGCDLVLDPNNPRIIYASTWNIRRTPYSLSSGGEGSALWKSTDGGTTWKDISENKGLPKGVRGIIGVAVSPANSNRIWAQIETPKGGLFRSDDGGENWKLINKERKLRQRAWYYTRLVADPQDEDVVYGLNVQFHKSKDGGKTFESIRTPHGDHHGLWIAPEDPSRMIIADDGGGQVTFDGGENWSTYFNQPTAQFYRVITDDHFPFRIYAAQQDNSTVRIKSRTDGRSIGDRDWEPTAGCECGHIAISPEDNDVVFGGCYDGFIGRLDHKTGLRRIVNVYPDLPMGHGAEGMKYRFQWNFPIFYSPHNPKKLYTASQHLHVSYDEGQSWEIISPDLTTNDPEKQKSSGGPITQDNTSVEYYCTIFAAAESTREKDLIWTGSDDGLVHLTRDGGQNWQNVTPTNMPKNAMINSLEIDPHEDGSCYLAATLYKVGDFQPLLFKTKNYGKTWTKITNGIDNQHFTRVIRVDPDKKGMLYAGTETGMYMSFDDGAKWQSLQLNLPIVPITDLTLKSGTLIAATQGRSIWMIDDLSVLHQLESDMARSDIYLFKPTDAYRFGSGQATNQSFTSGQNHHSGVGTHFYFKNLPHDSIDVKLAYHNSKGELIREFSRNAKEKADKLKMKEGANFFNWNMRYPSAKKFDGMIFWWASLDGPKAPPGDYTVTLTTGKTSHAQEFKIKGDPRNPSSQADLEKQFDFLQKINNKVTESHEAIIEMRDIRSQFKNYKERIKDNEDCLLYTSPSPRDRTRSRMPSSA